MASGEGSTAHLNRVIKSRDLRWAGHVPRIDEGRSAFRILTVKLQEIDIYEGLGVDERTILEWIFKKYICLYEYLN